MNIRLSEIELLMAEAINSKTKFGGEHTYDVESPNTMYVKYYDSKNNEFMVYYSIESQIPKVFSFDFKPAEQVGDWDYTEILVGDLEDSRYDNCYIEAANDSGSITFGKYKADLSKEEFNLIKWTK